MPKNGLLRAETDRRQLRWLVGLLSLGLVQFMIHFSSQIPGIRSMATTAASRAYAVQNLKDWLRPGPTFYIDFLVRDAEGGLDQGLVLTSSGTEFAFSMPWNLDPNGRCSQVRDIAEKCDGALAVAIFHLSIGRAHAAERLNATLDALRHPRALTGSHLA